jgi:pimeloyl-ACP methyl ester carboxylesterase
MRLNAIHQGTPTGLPPLVIAHGLFGSARNWTAIAKRLALHRQVVSVDMRNHGDSPRAAEHGYPALAADLAEVIEAHGGRADVLGHSMGGKAAMVLALTAPGRVARLIVADMAPVAYGHSQMPYLEAMRAVDLAGVGRRSQADAQLAERVDDPGLRAFLLQSLELGGEGARWKLNLDVLADEMPRIMDFPELDARFDGPTLFVTGASSDYVREKDWPLIRRLFPTAERESIAGAGHWVHAEAPHAVLAAVEAFLDRQV